MLSVENFWAVLKFEYLEVQILIQINIHDVESQWGVVNAVELGLCNKEHLLMLIWSVSTAMFAMQSIISQDLYSASWDVQFAVSLFFADLGFMCICFAWSFMNLTWPWCTHVLTDLDVCTQRLATLVNMFILCGPSRWYCACAFCAVSWVGFRLVYDHRNCLLKPKSSFKNPILCTQYVFF